jgi:hypothetical protein
MPLRNPITLQPMKELVQGHHLQMITASNAVKHFHNTISAQRLLDKKSQKRNESYRLIPTYQNPQKVEKSRIL